MAAASLSHSMQSYCEKRCCTAGTVEERILDLQERKRSIIEAAFGDGAGASQQATRLTKEDLHFLFTGQS